MISVDPFDEIMIDETGNETIPSDDDVDPHYHKPAKPKKTRKTYYDHDEFFD